MHDVPEAPLLQMDVRLGDPEANFTQAKAMIRQAAPGADFLVLPEMWNAGYALDEIRRLGDPGGRRTEELMSRLAREFQVNIVAGSVAVVEPDGVYNEMSVFDRVGRRIHGYRKIHRFRLMHEEKFLDRGRERSFFSLDGIPCGGMICYDLRFPELARSLVLEGAKLLVIPAQWPSPRIDHWRTLLRARAIENQCFVVAVNTVGSKGPDEFPGQSLAVNPMGQVLAEGGAGEEILSAELDLSLVDEFRQRIPVFADRQPETYSPALTSPHRPG